MVRYTLVSLPGTGRAEMTTVSPFMISTDGMIVGRHARQRGQRLALAAGGEDGHAVGGQQRDVVRPHEQPLRHVEVAEVLRRC